MCETGACRGKERLYVRLSAEADAALDRCAAEAGSTRSALLDRALRRFLARILEDERTYVRHPPAAERRSCLFVISGEVACMLERAKARTRFPYQELARHAIGDVTGHY